MCNLKYCDNCNELHDGEYGSGRFCSIKCAKSFSTKQKRSLINEKVSNILINKYLQLNNINKQNKNVEKICKNCNNVFFTIRKKQLYCSNKCVIACPILKKKRQETFKKHPNYKKWGGFQNGTTRGKSGWYKGYWCDSSYELAYVIYNLEHNIYFKRNTEYFEYVYNNKTYKYYPDFILQNNIYVEIKNYKSDLTNAKLQFFPNPIIIYYKEDIKKYLQYVINKYGKNFISLYDNYKIIQKKNKCKICNEPCNNIYCTQKCSALSRKGIKKNKNNFISFNDAKLIIHTLNLKSSRDWKNFIKNNKNKYNIPVAPNLTYKKDWLNWKDWLGY